jgi:hypothetical protein
MLPSRVYAISSCFQLFLCVCVFFFFQKKHNQTVMSRLTTKKSSLLANCRDHSKTADVFLQHCILPRCLMSPGDAVYCARFIHFLRLIGTPHFSVMAVYRDVFQICPALLSSCTNNESSRWGLLLREIFQQIHSLMDKVDATIPYGWPSDVYL